MKKVVVIGSGGAGKSTFSRKLGEITGLPVVHLDQLHWHPGWVGTPADEWREIVRQEIAKPEWIMDGNFTNHGAGELRRQTSDTVIWFDLPRSSCMFGIMRRAAGSYGQVRPEMAEGCPERFDFEFFRYVWTYRRQQRPKLLKYFEGLRADQSLVCFTERSQANDYLNEIELKQHRTSNH